jgi:hypothetical protein
LNQNSSIEYNTGYTNSYIENNNLSIGYLSGNTLDDSSFISENDVTQTSEISINSISSSSFISNNVVKNQSNIIQNTQSGGSELILNSLDNSFIYNNILNGSTIIQNYLTSFSEILYGNLNNSTIENNSLKYSSIDLLSQCLMDSKNIVKTNFVDSTVNDISENSVVIYDSYSKQVFTNSTGGTRISYYDGSDSLVIGNINDSVVPTLNITGWTAVSSYDVDVYVDITLDGGNSVTERGVVWNTSPYPTVADNVVTEGGTGTGQYTTSLTGLTSGSTIYFRGYAVNSSGTGYTCQDSYDTP